MHFVQELIHPIKQHFEIDTDKSQSAGTGDRGGIETGQRIKNHCDLASAAGYLSPAQPPALSRR